MNTLICKRRVGAQVLSVSKSSLRHGSHPRNHARPCHRPPVACLPPSLLSEFRTAVSQPDNDIPLFQASLLIAKHHYPDLDESWCTSQLDDMAVKVEKALGGVFYPMRVVSTVASVMYEDLGFQGNAADYYNPDNSCMNRVLEEKKGIPLSLGLVFMEVCQRLGVPLVGVNLPVHFMLKPSQQDLEVLIDPFNGEVCFLEDAEQRLSDVMGMRVQIDPSFVRETPPPTPRVFLQRMLNNLKHAYMKQRDFKNALEAVRFLRVLLPSNTAELLDEGLLLYKLNQTAESKEVLNNFLLSDSADEDAKTVAQRALLRMRDDLR